LHIASDVSQLHQSGPGSSCALNLFIWGVIQQCLYETKIRDIDDLRKRLMQTSSNYDQNIIDAGVTISSCVHADGGHFEHTL